jgi:hypothetical protein
MVVTWWDYIPLGVHNDAGKRYGIDAYWWKFTIISWWGSWTNTATEDTNRHLITIDKTTATVDGTSYSISYVDYTYNKWIWVFGYHNTQTDGVNYKSSSKLYKLDIYDENGTQINDLVPCYRKSDTVIWMYDIINDVFYTNEWTGTFTKWSDVWWLQEIQVRPTKKLPSEYQKVEWIQSSWTQYINTWWTPSSNYCRTVVNMQWVSVWVVDVARWMTNWSSWLNFAVIPNVWWWNPNTYYISAGSSSNIELFNYTLWIDVHVDITTTNWVYSVDVNSDSDTWSYSWTVAQSTRPMTIFALNENWTINWKTSIRLYSFKIYSDSTTLARDFVPCYRKLDSVIWLYDLVNDVFYTNSWTWTFTKWSDV